MPPKDDEEARRRIVEAALVCVDRHGPTKTGLSDVAAALGITRQTVYRLFPSTDELFEAVTRSGVEAYLDELETQLAPLTDPAEVVVEAIAYTVERLPKERHLGLLLASGRVELFRRGVSSEMALEFGRAMLTRTAVDWEHLVGQEMDEVVEIALRLLGSLVTEPNPAHADGEALRVFLRRWIGPALHTPPTAKPRNRKRNG